MPSLSLARTAFPLSTQHALRQHVNRRTLFSLPDLSSLSPFSGSGSGNGAQDPQTYHERKILPYKKSELYNIVVDVESYPRFLPFCTDTRVLSRSPFVTKGGNKSAIKMQAELTVGFMAFTESYTSDVTCIPNLSVEAVASSSTTLFKNLSTVWSFQPASSRSPHSSKQAPLSAPTRSNAHSRTFTSTTTDSEDPESSDNGPTLVTLDLTFCFANPVHAAVSAAFFGQVSRMMVGAFEERCLEIYGPGES